MAFGSMSGDLLESSSNPSPELAVLFYATDDKRAGWQVTKQARQKPRDHADPQRDNRPRCEKIQPEVGMPARSA